MPTLADYFRQMMLIRTFERAVLRLYGEGRLAGTAHVCIGQEADAVGVISALDRGRDAVWSNHRGHGHYLAFHDDVTGLLAEIMAHKSGICGGRGGSQHLCKGRFYSSGVQGGIAPCAIGTAFALKGTFADAIVAVFLGDGTMGEGVVYESLNLASLWNLPVLFVVEDNDIAQTTSRRDGVAGSISRRAIPFGIRSTRYAGTDVMAIAEMARDAVEYVRHTSRPAWLHLQTVRLGPHSKGDETRPADMMESLWRSDPIALIRDRVPDAVRIEAECWQRVEMAVEALTEPLACV